MVLWDQFGGFLDKIALKNASFHICQEKHMYDNILLCKLFDAFPVPIIGDYGGLAGGIIPR